MSGGRRTLGLKIGGGDRSSQAGDVGMVDSRGDALVSRFVIECKFYGDLEIGSFLFGKGNLNGFWKKLVVQADKDRKFPMLIAKQNHKPEIVCLTLSGMMYFLTKNLSEKDLVGTYLGNIGNCHFVLFNELLKQSPPFAPEEERS